MGKNKELDNLINIYGDELIKSLEILAKTLEHYDLFFREYNYNLSDEFEKTYGNTYLSFRKNYDVLVEKFTKEIIVFKHRKS